MRLCYGGPFLTIGHVEIVYDEYARGRTQTGPPDDCPLCKALAEVSRLEALVEQLESELIRRHEPLGPKGDSA